MVLNMKACVCCNEAADWRLGATVGAGHCTASIGVDSKTRHLDLLDLSYFTILNYC